VNEVENIVLTLLRFPSNYRKKSACICLSLANLLNKIIKLITSTNEANQ